MAAVTVTVLPGQRVKAGGRYHGPGARIQMEAKEAAALEGVVVAAAAPQPGPEPAPPPPPRGRGGGKKDAAKPQG